MGKATLSLILLFLLLLLGRQTADRTECTSGGAKQPSKQATEGGGKSVYSTHKTRLLISRPNRVFRKRWDGNGMREGEASEMRRKMGFQWRKRNAKGPSSPSLAPSFLPTAPSRRHYLLTPRRRRRLQRVATGATCRPQRGRPTGGPAVRHRDPTSMTEFAHISNLIKPRERERERERLVTHDNNSALR